MELKKLGQTNRTVMSSRPKAFLFVAAVIALIGVACRSKSPSPNEDPRQLASLLTNPSERDRAMCQLMELQRYRSKPRYTEETCKSIKDEVNHVVTAPQYDRSSIYIVFRNPHSETKVTGSGKAKGPFTLIDADGYILPVFAAANWLDEEDDVFAYAGDQRLAVAHVVRHGGGADSTKWTAQALHIVPVLPAQQSALSVVVGPPLLPSDPVCAGFYWSWRHRDLDGDGTPEIEIGPRQNDAGDIAPHAVYRWSKANQRYDGPDGSVDSGFLRVDSVSVQGGCCPSYSAIEQFVAARRALPTPGDPSAVRKDDCSNGRMFISR